MYLFVLQSSKFSTHVFFIAFSMEDPPMKEYQDYTPQEQHRNGYNTEKLHPSETIPMTQYEEQQQEPLPEYQQQQPASNPFKNQSQSNPFRN